MSKVKIFNHAKLIRQLEDIFCDEVERILDMYPDIFTKHYKDMFHVTFTNPTIIFIEDELLNDNKDKKSFSRKFIVNTYNNGAMERATTPCKAHLYGKSEKGNLVITRLDIRVDTNNLAKEALRHIWDIDNWIEHVLKVHAQHETGHILDYILSYDNKPDSELQKMIDEGKKFRKEWVSWWKTMSNDGKDVLPVEQERERLERYFNIPPESRADQLGKVDRKSSIDYQMNFGKYTADIIIKSKVYEKCKQNN
jgi:hypothetical protein